MARTAKVAAFRTTSTERPGSSPTVDWYEREATAYFRSTAESDLAALWDLFLRHIPAEGRVLDAGSGSGRDTKHFLAHGRRVDAFDASSALAKLSSDYTGQDTVVETFESWTPQASRYDGVWAFASLLHVARSDLETVIDKLVTALKVGGVLLASFKGGDGDSIDSRGRQFTNLDSSAARRLFGSKAALSIVDVWSEQAPAAYSEATTWVYVLAKKIPAASRPQRT